MTPDRQADETLLRAGAWIVRTSGWMSAEIGDELVLMNAGGRYIGFSETGKRIWELLAAPLTLAALCDALAREYEATGEQVSGEVTAFLHDLIGQGAVTLQPAPAG